MFLLHGRGDDDDDDHGDYGDDADDVADVGLTLSRQRGVFRLLKLLSHFS